MSIPTAALRVRKKFLQLSYCHVFDARMERPVFLVGCGRSGTTILGKALSFHPDITYLNEPRRLWISCYPETDIWSKEAHSRHGRLCLTGSISDPKRNRRLHGYFYCETLLAGKPRLLEKLPINSFRLDFLNTIFPDALFIHIVRNGLEVGRSIERVCKRTKWYGVDDYKWQELIKYAKTRDKFKHLPELCITDYKRGLLEWRLSVETAMEYFRSLPDTKILQVKYEELIEKPSVVLRKIERFIGVPERAAVDDFGKKQIKRKSPTVHTFGEVENEKEIVGNLLNQLGYAVWDN